MTVLHIGDWNALMGASSKRSTTGTPECVEALPIGDGIYWHDTPIGAIRRTAALRALCKRHAVEAHIRQISCKDGELVLLRRLA